MQERLQLLHNSKNGNLKLLLLLKFWKSCVSVHFLLSKPEFICKADEFLSVKNLFLSTFPNPFFLLIVSDQRANQWMDLFSVN